MDRSFQLFGSEPSTQTLGATADDSEPGGPCLQRGSCVGRYVIFQCLGSGGMGHVFAAYDPELDRRVALKVLRADLWRSEHGDAAKRLLLHEARAAAQLSHPHVVALHDVGTVDERLFLTMELIEGVTLADWLEAEQPGWKRALGILQQAGEGLAAAHRAGIVHRDFKPANLMISRDGEAKVVDFGLARALGERGSAPADDTDLLTGPAAGTPAYMAPEQRLGRAADDRSDQFSFCLTAYEALFGESPFVPRPHNQADRRDEPEAFRDPPAGSPVPGPIRRALLQGLASDPADRHPSMEALLETLRLPPARWRKWLAAATGSALVAGALGGLHLSSVEHQQLCRGAEERLAGTWDAQRKQDVHQAMLASGNPRAQGAWSRVESRIDDYTRRWAEAYTTACEATYLRGEQSPALLDRQMTCLDSRLTEIGSFSSWLLRAGPEEVDQATGVAAGLSDLSVCVDRRQALNALAPPAPELSPRVTAVRRQIAEAKTVQAAGHYPRAVELAEAGLEAAREVDYPPLWAEAHYRLALAQGRLGRAEDLRRHLSQTLRLGLAAEHGQIVARAMVYQMVYGFMTRDPEYSKVWGEMAAGAIVAIGGSPTVESQRLLMLGIVADHEARYEAAIEHYLEALETAPEKSLLLRGSVLEYIGKAQHRLGRLETAENHLRRAVVVTEQAYGPWHPLVGYARESLADLLEEREEHEEAIALRKQALGIFEIAPGPGHPVFAENLVAVGRGLLATAEVDQARPYLERARELLASQDGPDVKHDPAVSAEMFVLLARVARGSGQHESEVSRHLRSAREIYIAMGPAGTAGLEALEGWKRDEPDAR